MPHEHAGMAADLLPDAIITIGLDSNIQYANLAAERLFGFERGGMVGRSLLEAVIPPEMAAHRRHGCGWGLEWDANRRPVSKE